MANEEDYLDGLLNSITNKKSDIEESSVREEQERRERVRHANRIRPDDDFLSETGLRDFRPEKRGHDNLRKAFSEAGFLSDFEKELADGTADDFIRSFENELEGDDGESERVLSRFLNDDAGTDEEAEKEALGGETAVSRQNEGFSPENGGGLENFGISDETEPSADEGTFPASHEGVEGEDAAAPAEDVFPEEGPDAEETSVEEPAEEAIEDPVMAQVSDQAPDEAVLGNIDEIVKNAKESVENGSLPEGNEANVDLSSLLFSGDTDGQPSADEAGTDGEEGTAGGEADLSAEDAEEAAADLSELFPDGDTSAKEVPLMDDAAEGSDEDLLNILGDDSEFSDIGDLLSADENEEELPEAKEEFDNSVASVSEDPFAGGDDDVSLSDLDAPAGKGNFLAGLIGKLTSIFKKKSEDETPAEDGPLDISPQNPTAEELADEDADLLAEFGEAPTPPSEEPEEDDKGKKKKKEKKPKKDKKEADKEKEAAKKAKAEAAAKKKAEKAAKKAAKAAKKEPDTSPVIPKKALVVFVLFAVSVIILFRVFSGAVSYRIAFNKAEKLYTDGDYVSAYQAFSGMELKDDDKEYVDKARLLGVLDTRYRQYQRNMDARNYEMALSDIIIGTMAYEKNRDAAAELQVTDQYDQLGSQIEQQLKDQFGLTVDDAKEMFAIKTRKDFSIRIHDVLVKLGMITDVNADSSSTSDEASDSADETGQEEGVAAEGADAAESTSSDQTAAGDTGTASAGTSQETPDNGTGGSGSVSGTEGTSTEAGTGSSAGSSAGRLAAPEVTAE